MDDRPLKSHLVMKIMKKGRSIGFSPPCLNSMWLCTCIRV